MKAYFYIPVKRQVLGDERCASKWSVDRMGSMEDGHYAVCEAFGIVTDFCKGTLVVSSQPFKGSREVYRHSETAVLARNGRYFGLGTFQQRILKKYPHKRAYIGILKRN